MAIGVTGTTRVIMAQLGLPGAESYRFVDDDSDTASAIMTAPSGGTVTLTPIFYRDMRTREMVAGEMAVTGTPEPFQVPLDLRMSLTQELNSLAGMKQLAVGFIDGEYSSWASSYRKLLIYVMAVPNSRPGGFSQGMVDNSNNADGGSKDVRYSVDHTALDFAEAIKLARSRILSATGLGVADATLCNFPMLAGQQSGLARNRKGNEEFAALTTADVSNLSHLYWSVNAGESLTDTTLTGFTNFIGSGITKCGDNLILSGVGAGGGLLYINWRLLKAGAVSNATRSASISAGTVVNRVRRVTDLVAIAVGTSGNAWITYDAGVTWTTFTTGVAVSLTEIAVASSKLAWLGGASGTLVRWRNGTCDTVAVTGLSTTAINSLAVPPGDARRDQIYVGSAAGNIHCSVNGLETTPTWRTLSFDQSGTGSIDDMEFGGPHGVFFWFIQTLGGNQSRIVRDLSGGYGVAMNCEIIGDFTSPANPGLTKIITNKYLWNDAYAFGLVSSGNRFIEKVAPQLV